MNKYKLNDPLGKVGRSAVFLALEKATGKRVALKLFSGPTPSEKEKLLADGRVLQKLSHPNLVKILDVGTDEEDNVFYAMEYLDGVPLHQLVPDEQGLTLEASWPLIRGILSGVSEIHRAGLLHLDIKPGNILVVNGEPKLIDFGLLIPQEKESFRGTPGYVAPEIIRGQKPSIQSDIYSLGALLAFLWSGHKLFRGDTPEETLAHQLKNFSESFERPGLSRLIQRATKQDPVRRYQNTEELLKAISASRHEVEYLAEEPSEDPTQTEWGRWVIGSVVTALVLIAFAIYYALLTSV